jgi:hypothetical protein
MFFDFFEKKYEDIRILGIDRKLSQFNEDSCVLYLELSQRPPKRWVDLFAYKQLSPLHPVHARIEKNFMIIKCSLNDYEEKLMPLLQQDIDECNLSYHKINLKIESAKQKARN